MKITKLDGRRKYFFTFFVMLHNGDLIPVRTVTIRHYTVDNARKLAQDMIRDKEYLSSYYQVSLKG